MLALLLSEIPVLTTENAELIITADAKVNNAIAGKKLLNPRYAPFSKLLISPLKNNIHSLVESDNFVHCS